MASGVHQLTALSGHHQQTMWVCNKVFADFTTMPHPASTDSCCSTKPISPEEADIAHYIGGFVVSKLKQRSSASDYLQVLDTFVSTMEPAHGTLLGAKSRGRLTNLTKDAQSIFVELEQAFLCIVSLWSSSDWCGAVQSSLHEEPSSARLLPQCNRSSGPTEQGQDSFRRHLPILQSASSP